MQKSADLWADRLWGYFRRQARPGSLFFLAADERLIHVLAQQDRPTSTIKDSVKHFNDACLSLLDRKRRAAVVLEETFQKVEGRAYSRVICLAVQQVLVAERMLNDGDYSELCYFPRYRQCLGLEPPYSKSTPIAPTSFEQLWDTLKQELLSETGIHADSITFSKGDGRNLTRNFPMSQALFTTHDLTMIRQLLVDQQRTVQTQHDAELALRALAQELRPCARNLIRQSGDYRRGQLVMQLLSFLSRNERFSILEKRERRGSTKDSAVIAYRDFSDPFEDRFEIFEFKNGTQLPINEDFLAILKERTEGNRIILLARKQDSPDDRYAEVTTADSLDQDDTIIAIMRTDSAERFASTCSTVCETMPTETASNLTLRFVLFNCGATSTKELAELAGLSFERANSLLELHGGLAADRRACIFVAGYPPTSITHGGKEIDGKSTLIANDKIYSVSQFFEMLRSIKENEEYRISLLGSSLSFSIRTSKDRSNEPVSPSVGYALAAKFELSPSANILSGATAALRGVVFTTKQPISALSPSSLTSSDVLMLIDDGSRIPISGEIADLITSQVSASDAAPDFRKLATRLISSTRSIPVLACSSPRIQALMGVNPRNTK